MRPTEEFLRRYRSALRGDQTRVWIDWSALYRFDPDHATAVRRRPTEFARAYAAAIDEVFGYRPGVAFDHVQPCRSPMACRTPGLTYEDAFERTDLRLVASQTHVVDATPLGDRIDLHGRSPTPPSDVLDLRVPGWVSDPPTDGLIWFAGVLDPATEQIVVHWCGRDKPTSS